MATSTIKAQSLRSLFTISEVAYDGLTVSKGSSYNVFNSYTVSKSGYYPIGITGYRIWGSWSTFLFITRCELDNNANGSASLFLTLKNNASSDATGINGVVKILWKKV